MGLFGLALTFTFRPVNLLNNAFERVLYARAAEGVRRRQSIWPMLRSFLLWTNAVALPLAVVAWFVAEPLFVFLFGSRWQGCGVYVQALLPMMVAVLSATSLMFISNLFATQHIEFGFRLVQLALRAAAIGLGIWMGSFLAAVRLYAAAGTLVSVSLLLWYLWQVHRYENALGR